MKRIAMVVTDVAIGKEKGLGRMYFLATMFEKYGYQVDLITSRFQHWEKRFRKPDELDEYNTENLKISMMEEIGYEKNIQLKRIYSHRILRKNIEKHLNENNYDLVYALIPDNKICAHCAAYAKKKGIPFVVDVEDLWPEAMRMVFDVPVISDVIFSYYTSDARKVYRLADGVVGSSDTYRDEMLKYGVDKEKKVTVYVGNEVKKFDAGARENLDQVVKPENEFWVTYAGTLGTSYDIATLIRAADILKKKGRDNLHVMLLGDGPLRGEFEQLANSLQGNVTFVGYLPFTLMAAYLVKSDVTVNSLVRKAPQSFVSKIGDYLAAGKPMISTCMDKEFWAKVEADGFGVNVEPEDPQKLADAIEKLMDDPEACERMGKTARRICEDQFDRDFTYKRIVALTDSLLEIEREL